MSELIDQIFARARVKNLSQAQLAFRAGLRPETLSRLKKRDNFDLKTLGNLALAVGYELALTPLGQGKHQTFSPGQIAREKAESRRRDSEMIASSRASGEEVQRRNGLFSLPHAKFAIKELSSDES